MNPVCGEPALFQRGASVSSLRNLDLNLLKVFDAVYVSGSVSGAARRMGVSQPSVSRGLNRLRDHFEDPLFERAGNGVAPTSKAEAMLASVRGALSLIDSTIDSDGHFDPATQTRHFRLILPDLAELRIMPALINGLPKGSPVTFEVLPATYADHARAIIDGDVDVSVFPFLPTAEGIAYTWLFSDHGVLVSRKDHPALRDGFSLPLLGVLKFAAVPDQFYRLSRMDELLKTRGLKRQIVCTTHKQSAIPAIVATTDLVAFMARGFAMAMRDDLDLDVLEMPGFEGSKQDIYLAYRKSAEEDPAIRWLCQEIEAAYATDGADGAEASNAR